MRTVFTLIIVSVSLMGYTQTGFVQEGKASFYADKFEGRVTASGERYSHQKATCAHISLPFGSLVRVTNLANSASVVVRVNDRGPFVANRIIDLSQSAAQKLGFLTQGVTDVRIELLDEKGELVLSPPAAERPAGNPSQSKPAAGAKVPSEQPLQTPPPAPIPAASEAKPAAEVSLQTGSDLFRVEIDKIPTKGFTLQIGSYRELVNVLRIAEDLKVSLRKDVMVQTTTLANGDKVYRLMVGHFSSRRDAENFREKARKIYPDCFIVELK